MSIKNKVSDAEALSKEAEKELTPEAIEELSNGKGERTFVASEELEIPEGTVPNEEGGTE